MKQLLLAAVAVMMLGLVSACSTVEDPVSTTGAGKNVADLAATTIEHTENSFPFIGINPCTNEEISGDINYKFQYMLREQGNGKKVIRYKFQDRGVMLGTESGDKYQWVGGLDYWEEVEVGGCPTTWTLYDQRMLTVNGGKNNWILKYKLKFSFDCDWNFDVEYETVDSYCQ